MSRSRLFLATAVGGACLAGVLVHTEAAPGGGVPCSAAVTIIALQDGEQVGPGRPAVPGVVINYFVGLTVAPGCNTIPAGGTVFAVMPNGSLFITEDIEAIGPGMTAQAGPYFYTPVAIECPIVQTTALYRPAGAGAVDANSSVLKIPLTSCICNNDTNVDGLVDVDDLVGLILAWGMECP